MVVSERKEEGKGQTNLIEKVEEAEGWRREVGRKEREFYLCSQAG